MSFLFRREDKRTDGGELLAGVECIVRRLDDVITIQARAKVADIQKLKAVLDQVFAEMVEEHEAEPASPATPRRFRK